MATGEKHGPQRGWWCRTHKRHRNDPHGFDDKNDPCLRWQQLGGKCDLRPLFEAPKEKKR